MNVGFRGAQGDSGTSGGSALNSNDLLAKVEYPDTADSNDNVSYQYNRQEQPALLRDQNGTIHTYEYDRLGRQTHDRITTLGSGVDGAVRRISTEYDVRGLVEKVTSYDNATVGSGSVVNEVVAEYNDLGLLVKEYQEHAGAKDGSTLYVGYNYDLTAANGEFTKGLRFTSLRYPNGRLVHYTYGSGGSADDYLNRLQAIKDDSSGSPGMALASYTYLGLGTIVIEDYEEPDVRLDYFGGSSGTYAGFDDFDRVVDHRWYDYGNSQDVDRYKYGYDRASNRVWRENTVSKSLGTPVYLDEFYTYDGMHRLKNFDRGQLNGGYTGITGTPSKEEDWTLDPLGNWSNYVQKTSGATDLNQSRTVNKVNEITNITESTGPSWVTPAYDRNGNMTTIPKPADLANGYTSKYDAWNRLAEVSDSATAIGRYEYDGLARCTLRAYDSSSPDEPSGVDQYQHRYYSAGNQLQETRTATDAQDYPESIQPQYQYVWSMAYIDRAVLRDLNTDTDQQCDDSRKYYVADAIWSTTALLSATGSVEERFLYHVFGRSTAVDNAWDSVLPSSPNHVSHLFQGTETFHESLLTSARRRFVHNDLGKWVHRDPVEYIDDENLYLYLKNSPQRYADALGLSIFIAGPPPIIIFEQAPPMVLPKPMPAKPQIAPPLPRQSTPWYEGFQHWLAPRSGPRPVPVQPTPPVPLQPNPLPPTQVAPQGSRTTQRRRTNDCCTKHPTWPICLAQNRGTPQDTANAFLQSMCPNVTIWADECFEIPGIKPACGTGGGKQMHCTMRLRKIELGKYETVIIDDKYRVSVRCCNCCSSGSPSIERLDCSERVGGGRRNAHWTEREKRGPPECR